MPNLNGIGLQNFRTFGPKENLEFAPITIITGSNNAGKSSVFKAIQFIVHNVKEGIVSKHLDFKQMKHELGNMERIFNRTALQKFRDSEDEDKENMYSKLVKFNKENKENSGSRPIFEDNSDLVFAFPIELGGNREIRASLEIRYGMYSCSAGQGNSREEVVSHEIKSLAIIRDGKYLHWTNVIGFSYGYEEPDYWEMQTSINIKEIIKLIGENPLKEVNNLEPNDKTQDYSTVELFSRIKTYKHIILEQPFFRNKKDEYDDYSKRYVPGKSLFSDYSALTDKEKSEILAIDSMVTNLLLRGMENNHEKILDCFKDNFSRSYDGIDRKIVAAELKNRPEEDNKKLTIFNAPWFESTENSVLYADLSSSVEKDFSQTVHKKIDSFKRTHFLPATRGRNRAWFIDEQNGEEVQIVRDFSAIYLERHPQIENFVNFWIGKGEIQDENNIIKQKGFNIGKGLSVFRDESIGLTKISLVNFDDTKTDLVDLGYGVSQLLPIILKIATLAQEYERTHEYDYNNLEGYYENHAIYFLPSTLLIEEPEANLHPSLQSKMAELFIDAASRFNIQFLVETHSEYLIYKLQEYIGKKIVSPDEVKMYYFNHPRDIIEGLRENYINHVKIEKDGSIDYEEYFGQGFFDEQANLKLSLFNIQRDGFIEDYREIEEKLKASNESLALYDKRLEELQRERDGAFSDNSELQKEIDAIKKQKEEKESEMQQLLEEQAQTIDAYMAKTDYSNYLTEVKTIINETKIDSNKTLHYLATGKFLLKTLKDDADFAPVIIQFGRAVEFEMTKWMNDFKLSQNSVTLALNSTDAKYKNKLDDVINILAITRGTDAKTILINSNKVITDHLKNFSTNTNSSYTFGNLTQIFELLNSISPLKNPTHNYNSVPLIKDFANFLRQDWDDYDTAENLFDTYRYILNLRNCAGHTYSDSVCTNDIINRSTAEQYVNTVEAIFKCL